MMMRRYRHRLTLAMIAAVALAAGIAVTFALISGGDETPASPTPTTDLVSPTATAMPPTAEPPGQMPVRDVTHISIPRGGTIEPGWGIVLGNALTGGAEVWLMPGGTGPQGISPSGRYFTWGDSLFDGWTGARTKIHAADYALLLASFAPDDSRVFVLDASNTGRLLKLDGTETARLRQARPLARASASQLDVVWTSDSRAVAVTRREGDRNRVDVVIDDRVQPPLESNGMASWSNHGLRLAVTGDNPAIYDFADGTTLKLERGGNFPSWSDGDEFVAVDITNRQYAGVSALDAATGRELMRAYNAFACFDLYWSGSVLLFPHEGIDVPSGDSVAPGLLPILPALPRLTSGRGQEISWMLNDSEYASVVVEGDWASSFSTIRRDIPGFVPVLFLGLGGKDLCYGPQTKLVVAHPPFTDDQVPKPTPTPNK